jgi:hypothetical protein
MGLPIRTLSDQRAPSGLLFRRSKAARTLDQVQARTGALVDHELVAGAQAAP